MCLGAYPESRRGERGSNMTSEGSTHSSQQGMAGKRLTRQPGSRDGATLWGFFCLFPFTTFRLYPASDGWHAQVGLSTSVSPFRKCPQGVGTIVQGYFLPIKLEVLTINPMYYHGKKTHNPHVMW